METDDRAYLKTTCRKCGQVIEFPKEYSGDHAPCPSCGKKMLLASAGTSPSQGMKWFYFWIFVRSPLVVLQEMNLANQTDHYYNSLEGCTSKMLFAFLASLTGLTALGLFYRMRWAWHVTIVFIVLDWTAAVIALPLNESGWVFIIGKSIAALLYGIIWLAPNLVYFVKRKRLFELDKTS